MKNLFFAFVVALLVFPIFLYAFTATPLGGKVIATKTCDEGLLLTIKTPFGTSIPYMWIWGNLPYLSKRVPFVGQNILGMSRTAGIPCTISGVPYAGGIPIQYHGSSN